MKVFWLGLLALAACAGIEQSPADAIDMGTWQVTAYVMPQDRPSGIFPAAAMIGSIYRFDANRVQWPSRLQKADCVHSGYRLLARSSAFVPLFDPRQPGTFSRQEAGIEVDELTELYSECMSDVFINKTKDKMWIPFSGVLLVLTPFY